MGNDKPDWLAMSPEFRKQLKEAHRFNENTWHAMDKFFTSFANLSFDIMKGVSNISLDMTRMMANDTIQREYKEAIQKFSEMLVSVIAGAPWSRDASKMLETFSPASIVEKWVQLSIKMWEGGDKHSKAWWDYLKDAQEHVFDVAKSTIVASREAGEAANSLMQVFRVFDPTVYMQQIREGAYLMSLGTTNRSVSFWPYAERHLRTVSAAAVAAAKNAEEAAAALDKTINSFNWQEHLDRIRERAWWLWKGRSGWDVWDPARAFEDWRKAEEEILARTAPPKPDETI